MAKGTRSPSFAAQSGYAFGRRKSWPVKRLIDRRVEDDSSVSYLVEWEGTNTKGDPWPNSWQPARNVSEDLQKDFELGHSVLSRCDLEGIDLAPMLDLARVKLGNALKALKHGDLARDHTIDLECVAHESIARAFLMMVSSPDALPLFSSATSKRDRTGTDRLPIIETGGDGAVQVQYLQMEQIAKFASLEETFGKDKAKGLLIHNLGRASNVDMQAVALPLVFTAKPHKKVSRAMVMTMKFNTVLINGAYGTPRFPRTLKGALKQSKNRDKVVQYIRKVTPRSHPLFSKGWTKLPITSYELPDAQAVPA